MTPQPYIVCPKCGMVSHNPNDVEQRYCGNCHGFHDDLMRQDDDDFCRNVVERLEAPPGWEITLECGHKSWWAVDPINNRAYCSQCLEAWMKRADKWMNQR